MGTYSEAYQSGIEKGNQSGPGYRAGGIWARCEVPRLSVVQRHRLPNLNPPGIGTVSPLEPPINDTASEYLAVYTSLFNFSFTGAGIALIHHLVERAHHERPMP